MRAARGLLLVMWLTVAIGQTQAANEQYREYWLRIAVDHRQDSLFARVLVTDDGSVYVRHLDLLTLNLPAPTGFALRDDGERFHAADELPAHRVHLDLLGQHLHFIRRDGPPPFAAAGVQLLDILLDDDTRTGPVRVIERAGELWLPRSALAQLRVDPAGMPLVDDHIPVRALAGDSYALNSGALGLWMTVAPEQRSLRHVSLSGEPASGLAQPGGLSASADYDVSVGVDDQGEGWRAALIGAGVAYGYGHCQHRSLKGRDETAWRRLDSYCDYDWPDALLTMRVGDGISRQDGLGQSVRYAGASIGTDFSLAPTMNIQPDLLLLGTSRLPSTLELWVNQNLAGRESVGSGPFAIEDIPTLTGAGEIRLVVEDALGGREVIIHPYYSAPGLLRPGLTDWSLEAGRLREKFGLGDDRYTDHLAVLGGRRGMTDWLTLSGRAEYQESAFHGVAAGAALRLWRVGQLELASMVSRDEETVDGQMWQAGFSRRGRIFSFGVRHGRSDQGYRQLGFAEAGSAPARQSQANAGVRIARHMSATIAAFDREEHDGQALRLYSAGFSMRVLQRGQLRFSATIPDRPAGDNFYGLSFTLPLGQRTSGSVATSVSGDEASHSLSVQRNLPAGSGMGYRAGVTSINDARISEAEVLAQNNVARLGLTGRETEVGSSGFVRAGGSLLVTSSGLAACRDPGTAATVVLPTAGVRIYRDNQPVATTNARGRAVIAGLRPYEVNRLRLADDDLPINATLEQTELTLVPARRQVVRADFDVRLDRHVNGRLLTPSGEPVPPGASVWLDGERQATAIGHRGLLYLRTARRDDFPLEVRWNGGLCTVRLPVPEGGLMIQDIGVRTCE